MEAQDPINKINRIKYMNSFSKEIYDIYLKLKDKYFTELLQHEHIAKFVTEIQKK